MPKKNVLTGGLPMLTKLLSLCSIIMVMTMSSCTTYKIAYLKDIPDSLHNVSVAKESDLYSEPVIQPSDVLMVTVQTIDPQVGSIMNGQGGAGSASAAGGESGGQQSALGTNGQGYLVDKEGMVELPIVGKIKVAGLTTAEARDMITKKASEYFKEPIVNVRYQNFKVTVLGEVARPSEYIMPDEKVSILDAIGMAGDLTIYGKRDNVMLIRTVNGERTFVRFDLGSRDIFRSPYFYLRQGDVVYVEPTKAKAATSDAVKARNYSILATVVSLLIIIVTRIK